MADRYIYEYRYSWEKKPTPLKVLAETKGSFIIEHEHAGHKHTRRSMKAAMVWFNTEREWYAFRVSKVASALGVAKNDALIAEVELAEATRALNEFDCGPG